MKWWASVFVYVKASQVCHQTLNIINVNLLRNFSKNSKVRSLYDILGLKSTCTTKDVKTAYIKLCKELHPDAKPNDTSQHKKFVELNKAYTTLVNAESRKQYDSRQREDVFNSEDFQTKYRQAAYGPYDQGRWDQDKPWYEREDYQEYFNNLHKNNKFKATYRIRKIWIVMGCFLLITVGYVMYFAAYSYATGYTRQNADQKSHKISKNYNDARKDALEKGTEEQLSQLRKRWSS